jgi:AraC-like DNA-binding protein
MKLQTAAPPIGRGVLNAQAGFSKYTLTRHRPAPDTGFFIQHYWIIRWDLGEEPSYSQVVVSHPNVNLVVEKGKTAIYGISRTTTTQLLEGQGMVLGVKFRPGGFYPFWGEPLSRLKGAVSFREVFGMDPAGLEDQLLTLQDEALMVGRAEEFFRQRLPERDANVDLAGRIVDLIQMSRDITKVEELVSRCGIPLRTLQRLFSRYVGVPPKWVIKRYRLHDAAERIEREGILDWASLSGELGYFDQAHFIKDFKGIIGKSPEGFANEVSL